MSVAGARLPLVITGTIVPQSSFVHITDWRQRRDQYLQSLAYFCARDRVFFLENSAYEIESDPGFALPGLSVVKLRDSESAAELGKGYQEFRMLDEFLDRADAPARFMKLSGRRTLKQIDAFQQRYAASRTQWFDLWQNDGFADTTFFCCDLDFYRRHLRGLYRQADDARGEIIEKIVYRALADVPGVRFHPFTPLYEGQHGTSGNPLKGRRHIPTELRRFFRAALGKTKLDQRIIDWPRHER